MAAPYVFKLGVRARVISVLLLDFNNLSYNVDVRKLSANCYSTSPAAAERDKSKKELRYDVVVVGAGIVGIASARELMMRHPELCVCVVEKEQYLAAHQSGHNSGVIHAGVYYKPGSLRARLCVEGGRLAYEYFDKHGIPYRKTGKLIVATDELECGRLKDLQERGIKNKVRDMKLVDAKGIKKIEPHCQGLQALWCPHTGIVDWQGVAISMACDFQKRGGTIFRNFEVTGFRETQDAGAADYPVSVVSNTQSIRARFVLTCGGLHSDQLATMSGCSPEPRIIPFRGEYLILNPKKRHLVKGNIYPVPDPRFPFLGVHFTPRMDGAMWLGPNAVLGLKREGYSWSDYDIGEMFNILSFSGFRKLALKNIGYGLSEVRKSIFMSHQLKDLQKYIPELTIEDISRGPAGVRAQAMHSNGDLVDDFVFDNGDGKGPLGRRVLHCRNAPSPAATSSMAIARVIATRVKTDMDANK